MAVYRRRRSRDRVPRIRFRNSPTGLRGKSCESRQHPEKLVKKLLARISLLITLVPGSMVRPAGALHPGTGLPKSRAYRAGSVCPFPATLPKERNCSQ